jgi:hypothetical protein
MKEIVSGVAIIAACLSAGFGLYAALGIDIRDNMDAFISDLKRQSFWASWAAAAAGVSVAAQVAEKFLGK